MEPHENPPRAMRVRISSPADLLAAVPIMLGFHPDDSLVLAVLSGETTVHARVDLPQELDDFLEVREVLRIAARRARAEAAALVAYTDDACLARALVDHVADGLQGDGVDHVVAVRADGQRFYPLDDTEEPCCLEGHPYDPRSHPAYAEAVLAGKVIYRNREELSDSLVGTDPELVEAVAEAAEEHARRLAGSAKPQGPRLVAEGRWVRDRVRRYLDTREPLDADEAGRLAVALLDDQLRDVAWSEMRRENAPLHVDLWRDLVRRTPHELLAAPAGLLGFAAWLTGDGALAWCAVERCQEVDPDYGLARLLTHALAEAVPPSSWTPPRGEELPLFAR